MTNPKQRLHNFIVAAAAITTAFLLTSTDAHANQRKKNIAGTKHPATTSKPMASPCRPGESQPKNFFGGYMVGGNHCIADKSMREIIRSMPYP
jgi:hypothetical protein